MSNDLQERDALLGPPGGDIPPIRRGARSLLFALAGLGISALLLVVVFSVKTPPKISSADGPPAGATELVAPKALTHDDLVPGDPRNAAQSEIGTRGRGWIQITDQNGKLSQQYRCDELDPRPAGAGPDWVRMTHPEAQLYMANDRVLTLQGETALAQIPDRVLQSGTLEKSVVIRLYEAPRDGDAPGLTRDRLSLVVRTEQAQFDNILGEIHCPGRVVVMSRMGELKGVDLRLRVNDLDERIEHLSIAKLEDPIRIAAGSVPERAAPGSSAEATKDSQPSLATSPPSGATAPSAPAAAAPAKPQQHYLLQLENNVVVTRGIGKNQLSMKGDLLTLLFTLKREDVGMRQARAGEFDPLPGGILLPLHPGALMPYLIAGQIVPEEDRIAPPLDDLRDVFVHCDGRLLMTPASPEDSGETLESPEDAILRVHGSPAEVIDPANESRITCQTITHRVSADRSELAGSTQFPLLCKAASLDITAPLLRITHRGQHAEFVGAGRLNAKSDQTQPAPASGGAPDSLEITWSRQMGLKFSSKPDQLQANRVDLADFDGDVRTLSPQWLLSTDRMLVQFNKDAAQKDSIQWVEAHGSVLAQRRDENGRLKADKLRMDLAPGSKGRIEPQLMTATGNVEAGDAARTIWSDFMETTFSAAVPDARPNDPAGISGFGREVQKLTARGDVQVAMNEGGRVFADQLVALGTDRVIQLSSDAGRSVLMVDGQMIFQRDGQVVIVEEAENVYRIDGPGQAVVLREALPAFPGGRAARPMIPDDIEMTTTWTERLAYDGTHNDGRGRIDIFGRVEGLSTPTSLQLDAIHCDQLTLELDLAVGQPSSAAARSVLGGEGNRRVRKLIAQGRAELESRTWLNADRSDRPRVFNVSGPIATYDAFTGEALVQGAGQLLVRDEWKPDQEPAESATPIGESFTGKGTSLFKWQRQLHMTRAADGVETVVLDGNVEMLHRSLANENATLTAQTVTTKLRRASAPANDQPTTTDRFSLGGAAELMSFEAVNRVFVRTPTRDVDCDLLSYDYGSRLAKLSAVNRRLSILPRAKPGAQPIHAERAEWNLATDAVTITGASGAVNR